MRQPLVSTILVAKQFVLAALMWWLCTLAVTLALELNREYGSSVPWFPVPLCAFAIFLLTRRGVAVADDSGRGKYYRWSRIGALAVMLLVASVLLSGWEALISGGARLKGDGLADSVAFRDAYSLSYVLIAGVIEEFSSRRHCQVPLTAAVGRKLAWLVASFLFLLFHSFTKPTVAGLLFVLLMSISTGYLVYIGTSVRAVALLHAMVNAVPTTIVLIARAVAP